MRVLSNVIKVAIFWIAVAAAAILPPVLILQGQSQAGWAVLICMLVVMLATRFDAVEELSVGPLRAKLVQKLVETEELLTKLRKLAALTSASALSLTIRAGRLGGYSHVERGKLLDEHVRNLRSMGIEDSEIEFTLNEWHKWTELDYVYFILGQSYAPEGFSNAETEEWKALRRRAVESIPTPDELRDFLKRTDIHDDQREELLKDLDYYQRIKKHRRLGIWNNLAAEGELHRLRKHSTSPNT